MSIVKEVEVTYLKTKFSDINVYTFPMKVKDVLDIQYVAVRNQSTEPGAVQRILNKRRIASIKEFILQGNTFFSTFILNWTDNSFEPKILKDKLKIPIQGKRAQVIDGQHRLMGLQAAVNESQEIGEQEILVTLCLFLDTKKAAKIFLNINSEQKPVPKSLIYDLFGEAVDDREHSINRARDIIDLLHKNIDSPFYGRIKYPNSPRGQGNLDLSTAVNALKKHLESDGVFFRNSFSQIETQYKIIYNYFETIRFYYDDKGLWVNKQKNPFYKSAGFNGAIEFLVEELIPKCQTKKSFSQETFKQLLNLDEDDLLINQDLKNLDGKTAIKNVKKYFIASIKKNNPEVHEYEF